MREKKIGIKLGLQISHSWKQDYNIADINEESSTTLLQTRFKVVASHRSRTARELLFHDDKNKTTNQIINGGKKSAHHQQQKGYRFHAESSLRWTNRPGINLAIWDHLSPCMSWREKRSSSSSEVQGFRKSAGLSCWVHRYRHWLSFRPGKRDEIYNQLRLPCNFTRSCSKASSCRRNEWQMLEKSNEFACKPYWVKLPEKVAYSFVSRETKKRKVRRREKRENSFEKK